MGTGFPEDGVAEDEAAPEEVIGVKLEANPEGVAEGVALPLGVSGMLVGVGRARFWPPAEARAAAAD